MISGHQYFAKYIFCCDRADAHKQQVQNQEETGSVPAPAAASSATAVQDQRKALKFGFSAKGSTQRVFKIYVTD